MSYGQAFTILSDVPTLQNTHDARWGNYHLRKKRKAYLAYALLFYAH
jgi:hypothetical protein